MVVFNATLHVPHPQNPCVVMNMLSSGLFKRKKYVGLRVCDFEETKERNETTNTIMRGRAHWGTFESGSVHFWCIVASSTSPLLRIRRKHACFHQNAGS